MQTTTSRRPHARTRLRRGSAALLGAALVSASLAATASAAPVDTFSLSSLGGLTQFGSSCQPNGAPAGDASLDWNEDTAAATITPRVSGEICMQASSGVQAQVVLEYYDVRSGNETLAATRLGQVKTGTGGLDIFHVDRGGLALDSAKIRHVHVVLLDDRATPGSLQPVATAALDL